MTTIAIAAQLKAAGVLPFVRSSVECEATASECAHISGTINAAAALKHLWRHPKFKEAPAKLHGDVGFPRVEFRGVGGAFGSGSLQIVIGPTGKFYADLDRWNPLESVEAFVKHNIIEVFLPKWLRKKKA